MRAPRRICLRLCRVLSLLVLSSLGTVALLRGAPGYFADARELDAQHAGAVREALVKEKETGVLRAWIDFLCGAARLDFGVSRQYGTAVWPLVEPRLLTSLRLLVPSVLGGSVVAIACATLLTARRSLWPEMGFTFAATLFCAVPVSVVTLFCLISGVGGPAMIFAFLVAGRDFRFFSRVLRAQSAAPHLWYARASGVRTLRLLWRHLLAPMRREITALVVTSFLLGLNAMLPVEVIFGVPGIGQLAWNAAMERDLPVLLTITLLMALCVACASMLHGHEARAAHA